MSSLHPMLETYEPSESDPFDSVKAAHLLNRAGFGGTVSEIEHVRSIGPQDAVDELFDFPDAPAEEQSQTNVPDLSAIDGVPKTFREFQQQVAAAPQDQKQQLRQKFNQANREVVNAMTTWWLSRMASGSHPLQEKLTLFWHGHFTSSAKDERLSALMWRQNELLRRYAAGDFRALAHAISRDPAMLDYLNNTQNRREHPNENYAREVMELFLLGIGHYTEDDVKQGARAFTGWTHDGDQFVFHASEHDFGVKRFLNVIGNFNGDDVIDIILKQPNSAPFIAGELYRYFVSDTADEKLTQALGILFRESQFQLRPLLRTMLTSRAFYSADVIGAQVKSPVQLAVGTSHMLGIDMPPARVMVQPLTLMGQVLFMPPNVRGWLGGRTWINTSTLFVRYNMAAQMAAATPPPEASSDDSPEQIVDRYVARLIQRPISDDQRKVLVDALGDEPTRPQSLRRLQQLIVSTPEYQLC
jgi:uncharacterized protein (DUF1800 family)